MWTSSHLFGNCIFGNFATVRSFWSYILRKMGHTLDIKPTLNHFFHFIKNRLIFRIFLKILNFHAFLKVWKEISPFNLSKILEVEIFSQRKVWVLSETCEEGHIKHFHWMIADIIPTYGREKSMIDDWKCFINLVWRVEQTNQNENQKRSQGVHIICSKKFLIGKMQ